MKEKEDVSIKKEKPMYVKFISGKAGYGKEEYAVEWCRKQNLAYYRMSNDPDNPFSDYRGEPVIIWSDARDDEFKSHELYQLIDDHYSSMQKSRYRNRYIEAKYLLITTIIPLEQWYEKEDKTQLYRHILEKAVMDENNISFYVYNKDTNTYDYFCKLPNTYRHEESVRDTRDKQIAHILELLRDFKDELTIADDSSSDTNVGSNT